MEPTTDFATIVKSESFHVRKHADFITLRRSVERDGCKWYEDGEIEINIASLYRSPDARHRVEKDLGVGIETFSSLRGHFYAPDGTLVTRNWLHTRGTPAGVFLLDYEGKMLVAAKYGDPVRYYDETSYPRCHTTIQVMRPDDDDDKVRTRLHDFVAAQTMKYKLCPAPGAKETYEHRARRDSRDSYDSGANNHAVASARAWVLDNKGKSLESMPDQHGAYWMLARCAVAAKEGQSVKQVAQGIFNAGFVYTHDVGFLTWK